MPKTNLRKGSISSVACLQNQRAHHGGLIMVGSSWRDRLAGDRYRYDDAKAVAIRFTSWCAGSEQRETEPDVGF